MCRYVADHHVTKANSAYTFSGMENEFRSKYVDAVQLWSEGRMAHLICGLNVRVAGETVILINTCRSHCLTRLAQCSQNSYTHSGIRGQAG